MSDDETTFDDEQPDDAMPDDLAEDDVLEGDGAASDGDDDGDDDGADDDGAAEGASSPDGDDDSDSDTEALDDLEAEELEMLTEDEASETIVVDEEAQLRDIRRAQISIEASEVGGPAEDEFVCSVCFLVKRSSQLSNRRRKVCLDCAG